MKHNLSNPLGSIPQEAEGMDYCGDPEKNPGCKYNPSGPWPGVF